MTTIVNRVLSMDPKVRSGTDSYIDDIIVNEDVVSCGRVAALLEKYGLSAKPAEPLIGGRVLGLRITEADGVTCWSRDNKVKSMPEKVTKRQVFSLCGQLLGHFPIAGWLRPACSFVKRSSNKQRWDDEVELVTRTMLEEVMRRVHLDDPVRGKWAVSAGESGVVWCDASSLATGVCIEVDGALVEDASWLRKPDDMAHINLAELEAVLKGVNLALKWSLKCLQVKTDSATVCGWLSSLLSNDRRIKTQGLGEALVRRRLAILDDVIKEYGLQVTVEFVRSEQNRADRLTRVPKEWLRKSFEAPVCCAATAEERKAIIKRSHAKHHFGVDRSLYVVSHCYPGEGITREEVESVVRNCKDCLSVDPAPVRWEAGNLDCEKVWYRVAMDVTHIGHQKFLTIIDCGPSRFALWRTVRDESKEQIVRVLAEVFAERGPPAELLTDNSRTFRSGEVAKLCEKWSVKLVFRCVNRPSGNGIIERNHRTIKRMVARTGGSVQDMLFWYNFSPREGLKAESSPSSMVSSYRWRSPEEPSERGGTPHCKGFVEGDKVYVKPDGARCTSRWREGVVTGTSCENGSPVKVEVDGLPHHVADIRRMDYSEGGSQTEALEGKVHAEEHEQGRRPSRVRKKPAYLEWYECGDDDITGACSSEEQGEGR